jgi:hypothetical protein
MKRIPVRATAVVLGLLCLSSCNAAPQVSAALPGPTVPPSFARMFVGQCFSKAIFLLAPPFSPSPVPVGSIAGPCSNGLAFNASNGVLAVPSGGVFGVLSISIYNPPYSSESVPTVTIAPGGLSHPRQIAWDGSGNFWVADDLANKIYEFQAPFSVSSIPAAANSLATQPIGLAINPTAGLMFIGDAGGSRSCATTSCHVYVVPAPYTGAAIATFTLGNSPPTALAVDQLGRLFVGFDIGDFTGLVKVYLPPFVNEQPASYTLTVGNPVEYLAFDSAQNLYAQLYNTGGVVIFNGPVMGSMAAPSLVLGCPPGTTCTVKNWAGLAFGP